MTPNEQSLLNQAHLHALASKELDRQIMVLVGKRHRESELARGYQNEVNEMITQRIETTLRTQKPPSKGSKRELFKGARSALTPQALTKLAHLLVPPAAKGE